MHTERICPSEEILACYLTGKLSNDMKETAETHLARCNYCRELLADTNEILKQERLNMAGTIIFSSLKRNLWLIISLILLGASFICSKYFFQFIALSIIAGIKWAIDSKTNRMLISIHEAWKTEHKRKKEEVKHDQ